MHNITYTVLVVVVVKYKIYSPAAVPPVIINTDLTLVGASPLSTYDIVLTQFKLYKVYKQIKMIMT